MQFNPMKKSIGKCAACGKSTKLNIHHECHKIYNNPPSAPKRRGFKDFKIQEKGIKNE